MPAPRGGFPYYFDKYVSPEPMSGCWLWMGTRHSNGYGSLNIIGFKLAHNAFYTWGKGPIPPGLHIDHLCRNKACVNPMHLEAVPRQVNMMRSDNANRKKTHCPLGHLYDRVYYEPSGATRRRCMQCNNRLSRESNMRRVATHV